MLRALRSIVLPPEISPFERQHLLRMNRIALYFFLAHLPVMMGVAFLCGTGVVRAGLFTAVMLIGPLHASFAFKSPRNVSLVFGLTAMGMGGLLVHFGQGPMQIEMHFYFFVLLALLVMFANPLVIVTAAVTVALHHVVLYFVIPTSVFNYQASLWAVAVHAGFVALETIAACFVARSYFDNVMGLEQIIHARTEELRLANEEHKRVEGVTAEQRIRGARNAGMAEAATGVLHNVGNALNSVGVAASMIGDTLRRSKLPGLAKANELLTSHSADLADFLTNSPQGKQLPAYLVKLGTQLVQERESALTELDGLKKGIEHMTAIVGSQQALAKAGSGGSTTEALRPSAVFEDALAMALSAEDRLRLNVTTNFCNEGPIELDRHRLIQILMNMIQNADHALEKVQGEKRIALSVQPRDGRLRFQVRDNGMGIDPNHRVKIFTHGFTTRPQGHGFGLHASACAAMEMGGTLGCESEGVGLGSTFFVDVPMKTPQLQQEAA